MSNFIVMHMYVFCYLKKPQVLTQGQIHTVGDKIKFTYHTRSTIVVRYTMRSVYVAYL